MDSVAERPTLDDLVAVRRGFLRAVLNPEAGSVGLVRTQELLLLEMARVEVARRSLGKRDPVRHELKWHQQQLRIVGDTIAWLVFDPHLIRNLSKAPVAPPPSLVGQRGGLEVVLAKAYDLAEAGRIVLLADATNVIRNGDIVSLGVDGSVQITECKASSSTHRSSRGLRQEERVRWLVEYVTAGANGDHVAIAPGMKREYSRDLRAAVQSAVDQGWAAVRCSGVEMIFIGSDNVQFPDTAPVLDPPSRDSSLFIGFSSDLVNTPSEFYPPVTLWDLPEDQRLLIWEKDLIVGHVVAADAFMGRHPDDESVAIVGAEPDGRLKVRAGDTDFHLAPTFVDHVLYEWERPESARGRGLEFARQVWSADNLSSLADPGPEVRYDLHIGDGRS